MSRKLINKLRPKSEFSRNVLTLMTGSTIAQAIPIAISPILTRLYTPEDFGIFALYIGIVGFIAIIIAGRYELAIVLPTSDREAINILALSLLITITLVTILSVVISLFKDSILLALNAQQIGNLLYLVPLSLLLSGLNQSFKYWSNRKKYFQNISLSQISQTSSSVSMQLIFAYIYQGVGLIVGNIVGMAVAFGVLWRRFRESDGSLLSAIRVDRVVVVMRRYKEFPLVNSFHAFSDVARVSGSVMLVSAFFGVEVLGFYSLSLRILQLPIAILGSALGQILYQKLSSLEREERILYPYIKKSIINLTLVALPIFSILYIIAPDIFAFVFGEKWREAGEYTQVLIPYLFMSFILSPISTVPIILKRQKSFFYLSLIGNIGMPLLIISGARLGYGIEDILSITSLFLALLYLLILLWIVDISKRRVDA